MCRAFGLPAPRHTRTPRPHVHVCAHLTRARTRTRTRVYAPHTHTRTRAPSGSCCYFACHLPSLPRGLGGGSLGWVGLGGQLAPCLRPEPSALPPGVPPAAASDLRQARARPPAALYLPRAMWTRCQGHHRGKGRGRFWLIQGLPRVAMGLGWGWPWRRSAGDTVALQRFPQRGTCPPKRKCGAGSPPAHAFVLSPGCGPFGVREPEAGQRTA